MSRMALQMNRIPSRILFPRLRYHGAASILLRFHNATLPGNMGGGTHIRPFASMPPIKPTKIPVDLHSGLATSHEVYSNDDGDWDALLSYSEVKPLINKNKFYVIQLLYDGSKDSIHVYTRWGRVGEKGVQRLNGPLTETEGIAQFKTHFKLKTGIKWEDRDTKTPKKGKYVWLDRDFSQDNNPQSEPETKAAQPEKIPDSLLAVEILDFCKLIFSTAIMDATLRDMDYDVNKLPLRNLSKVTILAGFSALKDLAEVIQNPDCDLAKQLGGFEDACAILSGTYYTRIPHDFGRTKPPVIRRLDQLKRELDLVDALGDMEIASKLMSSSMKDEHGLNPLDAHFKSLQLSDMQPIAASSTEFKVLEAYCRDTHGWSHRLPMSVQHAFRVQRDSESTAWESRGFNRLPDGERLLLWHGSRTSNIAGILNQGLRIAPPEAPSTGYMFGKGVYFADVMSKSANYCHASMSNNTGILLLCEVAAKPFYERIDGAFNADTLCKSSGKLSTLGLGKTRPRKWKDAGKALGNGELIGCHMPEGRPRDVDMPRHSLQYNEYIVYDVSQIRIKYLLMMKMAM
ncbi:PARP-domain-containing protein [Mycena floridula]|nr:PARP-domain-containing protein [Mycena floridula]